MTLKEIYDQLPESDASVIIQDNELPQMVSCRMNHKVVAWIYTYLDLVNPLHS